MNAGASPREAVEQNNAQLFDDIGGVAGGDIWKTEMVDGTLRMAV